MKRLLVIFMVTFCLSVYGNEPVAIKNLSLQVSTVTKQEAFWIYSLKIKYWEDGSRIKVFLLPFSNPTHQQFVRNTLGVNPIAFQQTVESSNNKGTGAYRAVDSEYEMHRLVSLSPNSVGYVSDRVLLINSGDNNVRKINIVD